MSDLSTRIEKVVKQVTAILGEADVMPRTGRTRPDIGQLISGAPIAKFLDFTMIDAQATARDIEMLCFQSRIYEFASVCVNSVYVPLARELLKDSDTLVSTVVGFPLGASLPQVKTYEAKTAIDYGAQEIDVVIHIGALKARDIIALHEDISDVAEYCHAQEPEVICKVILETGLLTETEKIIACQIARVAGADFVQTSTGFQPRGATFEDIVLMRSVVGSGMGVKASHNIESLQDAEAMIAAGASRIGASSGIAIVTGGTGTSSY